MAALAAPTPTLTPTPAPQRAPAALVTPTPAPAQNAAIAAPSPSPPADTPTPTVTLTAGPTAPTAPSPTDVADPPEGATDDDSGLTNAGDIEAAVDWHAFVPTDEADHLATMDSAARDSNCGVPWQLLAAIARVESNFGRNMATSSAGAIGYGQFLPSSWQAFGGSGNVYDYRDALPAIALYLCQAGLERDPRAALFAYNHADWYVDLVLNLAVQYDRMAPGAPIPGVLNVGPAQQQATALHYASGRDVRQETRARTVADGVRWLAVPWQGRTPGQPIAADTLEATTLSMLRGAFGIRGDAVRLSGVAAGSRTLDALASTAWDAGLLALPSAEAEWTPAELRLHLQQNQPVVVFVANQGLPGHPVDERAAEQPLVLIGTTPTGFVYNDPTFASSLGYGVEISEADLLKAWDAVARPRQGLAFEVKPSVPVRQAHVAQAIPPIEIARALPTPTAVPAPVVVVDTPTLEPTLEIPTPTQEVVPIATPDAPAVAAAAGAQQDNRTWFVGAAGVGLVVLALGVVAVRRWRRPKPA